jgi:hypothetical protein
MVADIDGGVGPIDYFGNNMYETYAGPDPETAAGSNNTTNVPDPLVAGPPVPPSYQSVSRLTCRRPSTDAASLPDSDTRALPVRTGGTRSPGRRQSPDPGRLPVPVLLVLLGSRYLEREATNSIVR